VRLSRIKHSGRRMNAMINVAFQVLFAIRLKSFVKFGSPSFCSHRLESLITEVHMSFFRMRKRKKVSSWNIQTGF